MDLSTPRKAVARIWFATFKACVKTQPADSDGPQPSGCISVRTTLVSKLFEDKWRPGKAHALENIDARPD